MNEKPKQDPIDDVGVAADIIDHVSIGRFTTASRHQFFEGADRGQLLDIIPLLSIEEKNCVLVEADQGYGKTSLSYQVYVQALEQEHHACMIHGRELSSSDDSLLLQTLVDHLKIKVPEGVKIENGQVLAKFYLDCSEKQLVLIVDDAQQLSSMAVSLLLDFIAQFQKNRVQLVLFALTEAPVLLANSSLQDYLNKYGYKVRLRALNSRETSDYVRFLLIASERSNVKLSRQALSQIFQISAGVPSQVNEALVYALQDYDLKPHSTENQRSEIVPKWHLISLALVAVGVLGLIMFGNPEAPQKRFSETVQSMPEKTETFALSPSIQFTDIQPPQPLQPLETMSSQAAASVDVERAEIEETAMLTRSIEKNEPEREAPSEPTKVEKLSIDSKIAKLRELRSASSSNVERSSTEVQASSVGSSTGSIAGWVKGMPPNHYTLQLLGGANEDAIQQFVKANGSFRKMGYFETQHAGQPWYVVIYGDFSSRAQALAAADQLPNQLKSSKPWPRTAADIQAKMSSSRTSR